jgi:hypothetical protein
MQAATVTEIPHRGRRAHIGLGIALLGVDEVREFIGIADEEYRVVVAIRSRLPSLA